MKFFFNKYDKYGILIDDKKKKKKKKKKGCCGGLFFTLYRWYCIYVLSYKISTLKKLFKKLASQWARKKNNEMPFGINKYVSF